MIFLDKVTRPTRTSSRLNAQSIVPFLGLIIVIGLFAILTGGQNLKLVNLSRVVLQSVLLMIGCISAVFTIAHGHLDFALGGILGMSVAIGGLAGMINPLLTVPVIIIVAVAGELFVVAIHTSLNIPSFIVSLAMLFITKGVLVGITQTLSVRVDSIFLALDTPVFYYGVLLTVLILAFIVFEFTKIGKYNKAIGSNQTMALTSGIAVNRYKVYAFMTSGFTLGIGAVLNLVRAGGVSATTGSGYEINVLISLVLGGTLLTGGTSVRIRGAVLGALILTSLENGLVILGVQPAWVGLIKGMLFLAAIAVAYNRKSGQIIT